jgi:hypothetical protein
MTKPSRNSTADRIALGVREAETDHMDLSHFLQDFEHAK